MTEARARAWWAAEGVVGPPRAMRSECRFPDPDDDAVGASVYDGVVSEQAGDRLLGLGVVLAGLALIGLGVHGALSGPADATAEPPPAIRTAHAPVRAPSWSTPTPAPEPSHAIGGDLPAVPDPDAPTPPPAPTTSPEPEPAPAPEPAPTPDPEPTPPPEPEPTPAPDPEPTPEPVPRTVPVVPPPAPEIDTPTATPEPEPAPPAPQVPDTPPPAPAPAKDAAPHKGTHRAKVFAMSVLVRAPRAAAVGENFEAQVTVHNTGTVRLKDLTLALSAKDGLSLIVDPWRATVPVLDPGSRQTFTRTVRVAGVGAGRLLASCRDERGFAAAGSLSAIDIVPSAAARTLDAAKRERIDGVRLALRVEASAVRRVALAEPLEMAVTLTNDGEVMLGPVDLVAVPGPGVHPLADKKDLRTQVPTLQPGQRFEWPVKVYADQEGLRMARVFVRDARGWAAGAAVQLVTAQR